jgi:hypothetical protein
MQLPELEMLLITHYMDAVERLRYRQVSRWHRAAIPGQEHLGLCVVFKPGFKVMLARLLEWLNPLLSIRKAPVQGHLYQTNYTFCWQYYTLTISADGMIKTLELGHSVVGKDNICRWAHLLILYDGPGFDHPNLPPHRPPLFPHIKDWKKQEDGALDRNRSAWMDNDVARLTCIDFWERLHFGDAARRYDELK